MRDYPVLQLCGRSLAAVYRQGVCAGDVVRRLNTSNNLTPCEAIMRMPDAFLKELPVGGDAFRQQIPLAFREQTDSKQLRAYGTRVCDILAMVREPERVE